MNIVPPGGKLECAVCECSLADTTAWPKCGKCASFYHFKCCSGTMHQASWRSLTVEERNLWICPICNSVSPYGKRDLNSSDDSVEESTLKKHCSELYSDSKINSRLDKICEQLSKLDTVSIAVGSIQEKLTSIQADNVEFRSTLIECGAKVAVLEAENLVLKAEVEQLRQAQNENLQYQLKNNLIISNVPVRENENEEQTIEIVKKLLVNLDVEHNPWDIIRAHRLPPRKRLTTNSNTSTTLEPPAIIVKLHQFQHKKSIISASISKKPTAAIIDPKLSNPPRIYFNDHLTRETQKLFNDARYRLQKNIPDHLKYSSVKYRDGKIMAKQFVTSRPVRITKIADVDRLLLISPANTSNSTNTASV